jgi:predicted transcriptional regulator
VKRIEEKPRATIRRIDTEIVKRIVIALHDGGKERKTKIALKAHLAYDKCFRYIEWLELMGLIRKEADDHGLEFVNLTEKGLELYSKYAN